MQTITTTFSNTVLVIDDEQVVLDLFKRVLGEKGLAVRAAKNAEEAFALIDREGFGCVLADKNLPGTDGIEIVRRVRRLQPYCACIVMTGYASTASAVEALRLGAVDYLEKPFDDMDRIATRVDDALRAMKDEYERQVLLAKLRVVQGSESPQNDAPDDETVVEAPDDSVRTTPFEILEARVHHATADLRRRSLHLLSRLVATKAAGREVLLSGEGLLEEVRRLRRSGQADSAELKQIEQRLEDHLALARHAQSR
ncbi:MAG TPA: response regulator [Myxococcales bacterium]|jgi:CheY-like chemotaxis protein|nr:response regulator [Myxococcales bacterium]